VRISTDMATVSGHDLSRDAFSTTTRRQHARNETKEANNASQSQTLAEIQGIHPAASSRVHLRRCKHISILGATAQPATGAVSPDCRSAIQGLRDQRFGIIRGSGLTISAIEI
jgi:hypothetical protein